MRPCGVVAQSWQLLTLSVLFASPALAKDEPDVKSTEFKHLPFNLNYFDDSDAVVFHDVSTGNIQHSKNAGASWDRVSKIPEGKALSLQMHPFDPKTAYVLTKGKKHWKTHDRGESWDSFKTLAMPSRWSIETGDALAFNAEDHDRIIFNAMECGGFMCSEQAEYTTDNFKDIKVLRDRTSGCSWAKSTPEFTTGDTETDKKRILCVTREKRFSDRRGQRLTISDDFFTVEDDEYTEFEPNLDTNKGVKGVVSVAGVKKYILAATASGRTDEMALFVTDDTKKWHRAMFPREDSHDHSHVITQDGYTVLESSNYTIQIDVKTSGASQPMGVMFSSNSNGTYFTEIAPYTNRDQEDHVDFEKIAAIQGVFLLNVVENGAEVDKDGKAKKVISKISFDDGRTLEDIKSGDDHLHLHSVSSPDNIGRTFSSPAPGLLMGNGNTGDSLKKDPNESDLYVSDNAGVSWKKARDGRHLYEFGDSGSVLVAVKHSGKSDVKSFSYSLDHGENWKDAKLPDDQEIRPLFLTTVQDATSLKFLLLGKAGNKFSMIAIDFHGLHERKCGDDDMEDWHARTDKDGKASCIMGHKQTYRRRKKSADCFIQSEFKEPEPKTEDCECSDSDFECDYNFERDSEDSGKCKLVGSIIVPEGSCKDKESKFKGSSGWRLIPGNTCKRKDGEQKDDLVEHECSGKDTAPPSEPSKPASGNITHKAHPFDSKFNDFQKFYLEDSKSEVVIARPAQVEDDKIKAGEEVYRSKNHGKDWEQILKGEKIQRIVPHEYFENIIFFTTSEENKVIYTIDAGARFRTFKAPNPAHWEAQGGPLLFHPNHKDWLIWIGKNCEKIGGKENCNIVAYVSTNHGGDWHTMREYVDRCQFTGNDQYEFRPAEQVLCLGNREEKPDSERTVMISNDMFKKDEIKFVDGTVSNFATMSEFIVIRQGKDDEVMDAMVSLDGKKFDKIIFPHNFKETHTGRYTVLNSANHAVNLFIETSGKEGHKFGSIMRSNSNGTTYVLSASHVNSNKVTFTDFESIAGLEGVSVINVVSNPDSSDKKALQTKISHNDGADWGFLQSPAKDPEGKSYSCTGNSGSCALHFHHYTEREDKGKGFAVESAVGFMVGVGNVGPHLGDIKDADTFISSDAGLTWKSVKKGQWAVQYGDQGSIIVLVQRATHNDKVKTKTLAYSLDNGQSWNDYEFSEKELTITDITTVSAGTSRSFLLWGHDDDGKGMSINVDFTGLTNTPCKIDKSDSKSDYELWSPRHPLQDDDCIFGHVSKYLRKKTDRECFNEENIQVLHKITDCQCSRSDFECAFNYQLDNHGQCNLVKGLQPLSGAEWCKNNPNETVWYEPTGYRRAPSTTCQGGKELDKSANEHPCAGHEEDFEKRHRSSFLGVFFAIVIPFALAGAIGHYVYRNWHGKFGQIRLGDASSTFDSDQPWIKYPVIAVSAVAAVAASLPILIGSLVRSASDAFGLGRGSRGSWFSGTTRFTTRDSFTRNRGAYAIVEDVEGELLGEESDDEF